MGNRLPSAVGRLLWPAGISSIPDVPNPAGQRGPYLLSEMRAFLAGTRGNDTMNGAITYLIPVRFSGSRSFAILLIRIVRARASAASRPECQPVLTASWNAACWQSFRRRRSDH